MIYRKHCFENRKDPGGSDRIAHRERAARVSQPQHHRGVQVLGRGDALAPKNVLAVLQAMYDLYQEPRYRPSPWLRRRAQLGVSLLTPE